MDDVIADSHYLIACVIRDLQQEQDKIYVPDSRRHILMDVISKLIEANDNLKSILPKETV